jgi:hypothetical protein
MTSKTEFIMKIVPRSDTMSVDSFIDFISGTVKSLYNISNVLTEDKKNNFGLKIKSINLNSPGDIRLVVTEETDISFANRVFKEYFDGCRLIDNEVRMPESFDDEILDSLKQTFNPLTNGIKEIAYSYGRIKVNPSTNIIDDVKNVIAHEEKESYYCWTTLEGTLLIISGAERKRVFKIKDMLLPRTIKCYFNDDILNDVLGAFEKRVSVYGKTKYNKHDIPVLIQVDKFEIFPDENDLPRYEDLPSIDITGGESIEDHLEKIRNVS